MRFSLAGPGQGGLATKQAKQDEGATAPAPCKPGNKGGRTPAAASMASSGVVSSPISASASQQAADRNESAAQQVQREPRGGRSSGVREQRRKSALARSRACELLALGGSEDMQDFLACLILAECVYKKVELDSASLLDTISALTSAFPPGWVSLDTVQISRSDVQQHYLLATGGDALYVAFMGTKQPRDLVTDATFLHSAVWAESVALASDKQSVPAAHSGFLQRARAIHVEQLHELATASGRRLVLCGHSLGGAVAKLSTLRLLRDLPEWPAPKVKCMCFATPAIGNAALADLVRTAGWGSHFKTFFLPEDQVMRLMSFSQIKSSSSPTSASSPQAEEEAAGQAAATSSSAGESDSGVAPWIAEPGVAPKRPLSVLGRWSWRAGKAGKAQVESPPAQPLSMVSTMDATEAAMEDILSAADNAIRYSASDSELPTSAGGTRGRSASIRRSASSTSLADASAAGKSVTSEPFQQQSPPFNLGLAFALQHKRVLRAVQKIADHAHIPLPILPRAYYHTFGAQLYIHADRAYHDEQPPAKGAASPTHDQATVSPNSSPRVAGAGEVGAAGGTQSTGVSAGSSAASDLSRTVKGPFNYHRMVAHRLRVLSIIASALPEEQRAQHYARVTASTAAVAAAAAASALSSSTTLPSTTSTPTSTSTSSTTSTSSSSPLATPASPVHSGSNPSAPRSSARSFAGPSAGRRGATGSTSSAGTPLSAFSASRPQSDGLFPRISAAKAVARLPLDIDLDDEDGSSTTSARHGGSASAPGVSTPAGGSGGRKLAGLWGKKAAEKQVALLLEVEGHNLQYCHHVAVKLTLGSGTGAGAPGTTLPTEVVRVISAPLRDRNHPLTTLQNRLHQVAGSVGRYISRSRLNAKAGNEPTSRMVLQVMVPRSVAEQLRNQMSPTAPETAEPEGVAGVGPRGAQAPLVLQLRSHFHEDEVEVWVQPYQAAVLGTSLTAATLLQAALMAPTPRPAPAFARGSAPASQAAAGGDAGSSQAAGREAAGQGSARPRPAAGMGGLTDVAALATSALAMRDLLASWLRPQAVRWAQRLWSAPPAGTGAGAHTPLTEGSMPVDVEGQGQPQAAGAGYDVPMMAAEALSAEQHALLPMLLRRLTVSESGLPRSGSAVNAATGAGSVWGDSDAADAASCISACNSVASCGGSSSASIFGGSDTDDEAAASALLASWQHEAALSAQAVSGDPANPEPARGWAAHLHAQRLAVLQPVAALLLMVRLLGQATARITSVRTLSRRRRQSAAGTTGPMPADGEAASDAPQLLHGVSVSGFAGAAMLMRRRAASYAATVTPGAGGLPLQSDADKALVCSVRPGLGGLPMHVRWLPRLRFMGGLGLRTHYMRLVGRLVRPQWAAAAAVAAQSSVASDAALIPAARRTGSHSAGESSGDESDQERTPLLAAAAPLEPFAPLLRLSRERAAAWAADLGSQGQGSPATGPAGSKRPASTLTRRGSREPVSSAHGVELAPGLGIRRSISYTITPAFSGREAASALAASGRPAGTPGPSLPGSSAGGDAAGTAGPAAQQSSTAAKQPSNPRAQRAAPATPAARQSGRSYARGRAPPAAQAGLGVPPQTACLGGSLLIHNILASAPSASPFVVLRALTAALRRQASRLRRCWSAGGVQPQWESRSTQGAGNRKGFGPLQPAGALLNVYNFLRGIPFWIQQRRSQGVLTFDQDWKVMLIAASALDPPRLLQGRDFARLALRASAARVTLLPVLLTSPEVPAPQEQRARAALGAACGVDASAVRSVEVDLALLQRHSQGQAGSVEELLAPGGDGLERLRAATASAAGVASVRRQLQVLLQQQDQSQKHVPFGQQQRVTTMRRSGSPMRQSPAVGKAQ